MSLSAVLSLAALAAGSLPSAGSSDVMPKAFRGHWDLKSEACADQESLGVMWIDADRLRSWEATDHLLSVKVERADTVRLMVESYDANAVNPEKPTVMSLRLKLVDGGKRLKYQADGEGFTTFSRCVVVTGEQSKGAVPADQSDRSPAKGQQ